MTPYIKKIVELHKIHKAIEDKDCNGGGNTSSGDITIDDVVKFIHDEFEKTQPDMFPYTAWDEIPEYADIDSGFCKTDSIYDINKASAIVLNLSSYIIGYKQSGQQA